MPKDRRVPTKNRGKLIKKKIYLLIYFNKTESVESLFFFFLRLPLNSIKFLFDSPTFKI